MPDRRDRKTVYTLNLGPYSPEITALTYPLLTAWTRRIGAEFVIIDDRRFPAWPVCYEKLQIYERAQAREDDWSIFVDSDALVHPDTPDFTVLLPRDTVAHNDSDMAAVRWDYDHYFKRDGRHLGSGNWLAFASSWCLDLWRPLDDLTLPEALAQIHPVAFEVRAGITPAHLLDDYVLSRNIARFGLKFTTVKRVQEQTGCTGEFFHHEYLIPEAEKVATLKQTLVNWKLA
jgi:hypothetical protein